MKLAPVSPRRPRLRFAILCGALVAACAANAAAQAGARVVVENARLSAHPVEIVGVEVAGETHEFAAGRPGQFLASFDAREDWLRQFAFRVRNTSDKAILWVNLSGWLAAGEEGEIPMGIEALYGQELDESAFTGLRPRGEPRRLAPGETASVRWSAGEYESMVRFLSTKRPLAAYRKMRIDLREARFEDGTVWTLGGLYRIDPNDPRKWTPLDGRPRRGGPAPELNPGERIVEVDPRKAALPNDSDVLTVTDVRVNGESIVPGRPFTAGADWLRGLTVRVRNDSSKPIASVEIGFGIPEASYRGSGIGFRLVHGSREAGRDADAPGAKLLLPGEELEFGMTGDEYEMNRRFADKRGGVAEISRVTITAAYVVFADGTKASVSDPLRAKKPATPAGTK